MTGGGIAIIGMAGRFPGAPDVPALWSLLRDGREGLARLDPAALAAEGVAPELLADPRYVPAAAALERIDAFDAGFWSIPPHEAALMDPQQRILLETAWHALEDAHLDPKRAGASVGVFVGAAVSTYLLFRLHGRISGPSAPSQLLAMAGNDKDYAATQLAYRLDLKGPAVSVQTACSSSLVAVHMACQSLLSGECDVAIAGGVSIRVPHRVGYLHEPGGMLSPDGHCRSFAEDAAGTVFGSGCGLVVLRRLEDTARDRVRAVLLGTAVNNDGAAKVGFAAPSQDGQAAVIAEALAVAGIAPEEVGHVEAHGTGTPLGDPIEVAALNAAFRGVPAGRVLLGSVKSNLGHLETAAGVTGLIKTVLMLEHAAVAPTLHAEVPSGRIAWAGSPFRLATRAQPWETRRVGGVSSFGIGGTNAHAVVGAAPARARARMARPRLLLSAADPAALADLVAAYRARLAAGGDVAELAAAAARRPRLAWWVEASSAEALAAATPQRGAAPAPEPAGEGAPIDAPAYPFRRERHWAEAPAVLLGPPMPTPRGEEVRGIDLSALPWLHQHRVAGRPLLPGAAHLALLAEAGIAAARDVAFTAPLPLDEPALLQLWRLSDGTLRVEARRGEAWTTLCEALAAPAGPPGLAWDVPAGEALGGDAWAARLADAGFVFGPAFRRIAQLRRAGLATEAQLAEEEAHPVSILDAGLQALGAAVAGAAEDFRPARIARFTLHGALGGCRVVRARITAEDAARKTGDVAWLDGAGAVLAEARGVECRRALGDDPAAILHRIAWRPSLDPALEAPHAALERIARGFIRAGLAEVPRPARTAVATLLRLHAEGEAEADPSGAARALAAAHPDHAAEIELVVRCGARLPEVLAGTADPLDVLFGGAGAEGAYAGSPLGRALNGVAAGVAAAARPRRVLEIGGGTAATTAALRAALPPDAEYVFTDIAPGFLAAAARRFADWPGFRTTRLDIDQPPAGQGIEGRFDIVVAANVLHAAPDLRRAVAHAAGLLVPGGRLLLVEGTGPQPQLDLTFGLTEGWTARRDHALRPNHPLVPPETWRALLAEAGLPEAVVVAELGGQVVLSAGEARWIACGRDAARAAALGLPFQALGAPLPAAPLAGVVALCGLEAHAEITDLLRLSRTLAERADAPRLLVPTSGAEALAPGEAPDPARAALGGFVRTLAREHPRLAPRTVDLAAPEDADALAVERALADGEDRVAWRDGVRLVPRLATLAAPLAAPEPARVGPDGALHPMPLPEPGPGQVRLRVRAAGLNFKDVLMATGRLPPGPLGGEAAGEVEAVGPGVTGLAAGDAVVAVGGGALATHLVADAALVLPKPAVLSFAQAAAVPIAGVTAWHALHRCAGIRPGQRVLVHQATGGVGSFALALARRAGAEVVATAGSPAKRAFLAGLGVAEVRDSRRPDLDGIAPLDAVVGALAPSLRPAAIAALKPGGHYVEIGRAEAATAEEVAALRPEARFHGVALDAVDARSFGAGVAEVLALLADHPALVPPVAALPMGAAGEAFGAMLRARHVGKIVLLPERRFAVGADGTWLVTGARGGLGPLIVAWLRARGAGAVLRLARRGDPAPDLVIGDVADPGALDEVEARRAALGLPPVRGVVHAAGVLEDGVIAGLDAGAFARVARPKVGGIAAIVARWPDLDLLLGFSSAGGQLGSSGQAAHTAASAALDAALLAARARGVPAVTIDWGAWAGVGAAAVRGVDLAGTGVGSIAPERGFAALDAALAHGLAQLVALPVEAGALRAGAPVPPLLRDRLAAAPARMPEVREPAAADVPAADRRAWLREQIVAACAGLLTESGRPDARRPLADLGLDSLGALELRNRLGRVVGAVLPASLLFDHPTVAALTEHLAVAHLGLEPERPAQPAGAPAPAAAPEAEDVDSAFARFAAMLGEDAA